MAEGKCAGGTGHGHPPGFRRKKVRESFPCRKAGDGPGNPDGEGSSRRALGPRIPGHARHRQREDADGDCRRAQPHGEDREHISVTHSRKDLVDSQTILLRTKEITMLFAGGLVGANFSKPIAFYLDHAEGYLEALQMAARKAHAGGKTPEGADDRRGRPRARAGPPLSGANAGSSGRPRVQTTTQLGSGPVSP